MFAAIAIALYVGHHVGDYWVQTDEQAKHKGYAGSEGAAHCALHCLTYVMTQLVCVLALLLIDVHVSYYGLLAGLVVSGVTHYLADRREYGIMFRLARRLPGKSNFLKLGVPRRLDVMATDREEAGRDYVALDNPSLGTGAWALDQSWHIFWGVFVAALLMAVI